MHSKRTDHQTIVISSEQTPTKKNLNNSPSYIKHSNTLKEDGNNNSRPTSPHSEGSYSFTIHNSPQSNHSVNKSPMSSPENPMIEVNIERRENPSPNSSAKKTSPIIRPWEINPSPPKQDTVLNNVKTEPNIQDNSGVASIKISKPFSLTDFPVMANLSEEKTPNISSSQSNASPFSASLTTVTGIIHRHVTRQPFRTSTNWHINPSHSNNAPKYPYQQVNVASNSQTTAPTATQAKMANSSRSYYNPVLPSAQYSRNPYPVFPFGFPYSQQPMGGYHPQGNYPTPVSTASYSRAPVTLQHHTPSRMPPPPYYSNQPVMKPNSIVQSPVQQHNLHKVQYSD